MPEAEIKPPRYFPFDYLPYPRVVFPVLALVNLGYAGLVTAEPHWASKIFDALMAGK